jgi:hypothetical protein
MVASTGGGAAPLDGLFILGLVVVLAALLKPALPSWLPVGVVRLAVMLEHLH